MESIEEDLNVLLAELETKNKVMQEVRFFFFFFFWKDSEFVCNFSFHRTSNLLDNNSHPCSSKTIFYQQKFKLLRRVRERFSSLRFPVFSLYFWSPFI
jgi:hypothetical protein